MYHQDRFKREGLPTADSSSLPGQDGRRAHEAKDREDFDSFVDRSGADKQRVGFICDRRDAGSLYAASQAFAE